MIVPSAHRGAVSHTRFVPRLLTGWPDDGCRARRFDGTATPKDHQRLCRVVETALGAVAFQFVVAEVQLSPASDEAQQPR